MLSGIGPADHLQEHGISVVVDNPAVGDHLVDHPIVDTYLKIKAKESVVGFLANPNDPKNVAKLLWHGIKYYLLGTGGAFAMNVSLCQVSAFDTQGLLSVGRCCRILSFRRFPPISPRILPGGVYRRVVGERRPRSGNHIYTCRVQGRVHSFAKVFC